MHPLFVPETDQGNVRVLALSLGSARLYVEKATKAPRCSMYRLCTYLGYCYYRCSRSISTWFERAKVGLFGERPKTAQESQQESQMLQSPINTKPQDNSDNNNKSNAKEFALPAFANEEICFLGDIVKYVCHHSFDVVLLQEVYSEQTFVHLCQMFKEASARAAPNQSYKFCHYAPCAYVDPSGGTPSFRWATRCFSKETRRSGLVVFSRWPLLAVQVRQFDPILSKSQLCNPLKQLGRMFCCGTTQAGGGDDRDRMLTGALNLANGVQYVQIEMANPMAASQTVMLHVFNVDLLHKSFVPLNPVNSNFVPGSSSAKTSANIEPIATGGNDNNTKVQEQIPMDELLRERFLLRLCQAYELAKFVNVVANIRTFDKCNFKADIVLVGGHFGGLLGDQLSVPSHNQYAFPCSLTVQDVLQTFVDGLHNVYQFPERLVPVDEPLVYRAKLFHAIKSEQLFMKFIMPSKPKPQLTPTILYVEPNDASVFYKCKVEFIHSKIKFGSYLQAVTGSKYENLMKPMIETPRAIHIRVVNAQLLAQQNRSPRGLPGLNDHRNRSARVQEVELHSKWCTEERKLQVIEALKNALLTYKRQLKISLFRNGFLNYFTLFMVLMLAVLLGLGRDASICLAALLLFLLYTFFRKQQANFLVAINKIDSLMDELTLDWTNVLSKLVNRKAQPFEQDAWLKFYQDEKVVANLATVQKAENKDDLGIKLVDSDEENELANESAIEPTSTTTF